MPVERITASLMKVADARGYWRGQVCSSLLALLQLSLMQFPTVDVLTPMYDMTVGARALGVAGCSYGLHYYSCTWLGSEAALSAPAPPVWAQQAVNPIHISKMNMHCLKLSALTEIVYSV